MAERLGQSEETNKQLVGQVNFLGKTNESLMEEIDDSNERMSAELATCRQGRDKAETRCTVLPPGVSHERQSRDTLHGAAPGVSRENEPRHAVRSSRQTVSS